jgi:hypothetical protein
MHESFGETAINLQDVAPESNAMISAEGGCRCRRVRYICRAAPLAVTLCYCRDCQSWSGGPCGNFAIIPAEAITVTGVATAFTAQSDSGRVMCREFCPDCGSPLFASTPHLLAVAVASFDDPSPFRPTMAIWLDRAPAWVQLPDDIARYPRNPPLSSGA